MLARLIQFALTQRLLILLATAALIGGGWRAFQATPIDAFPDVSTIQVKIIVKAPGMTPEEVESRITQRIELEMLGIAVLNGVVMVTYFNQLSALGRPIGGVVVEGARRRLRPVLMTASIAAFGLVPLLFATGPGSEIQRPLAIVVIGGLVSR